MGWSHPDISLEDLMKLIKGFVDILILTSGYQSSGRPAHWDPININQAFQWALFFENVLSTLSHLDVYQDSMNELDMALSKITSAPSFPQGLADLSSATLTKARGFLMDHFIYTLPLRDSHLRAFLTATVQTDLDELSVTEHDFLSVYLSKLKLENASTYSVQNRGSCFEDLTSSQDFSSVQEARECNGDSFTKYAVQKLLKRWSAVLDISTIEKSLKTISDNFVYKSWREFDDNLFKEQLKQNDAPVIAEQLFGFMKWNCWKSKNLSYFLDNRTIRMVSGASMIFSAPKIQWAQVLDRISISTESNDDSLRDITELLLLGCIASRWTNVIEHLMSVSYNSVTTSEQYHEVCKLLPGKSHTFESKEEMSSKEKDFLGYLTGKLGGQLRPLWNISPALTAVSIPSWSPLFRFYLSELDIQLREDFSEMRCCSCNQDRKEHND
ncbi:hypothetical protein TIFTF001_018216 [Ficus carica]|uniref:Uncharacterized protein n=1 Tax=Ficus carica TaxID=3494 RepID=A0AA88AB14_FICCA|nr:hypothetical protein TIFTF001_018216 [Ficus carica]